MTNTQADLDNATTIYLVVASPYANSPTGYIQEITNAYDPSAYADLPGMTDEEIDEATRLDWINMWTQGDDVYATEAEAEAAAEAAYLGGYSQPKVLEVTRAEVRQALLNAFGEGFATLNHKSGDVFEARVSNGRWMLTPSLRDDEHGLGSDEYNYDTDATDWVDENREQLTITWR